MIYRNILLIIFIITSLINTPCKANKQILNFIKKQIIDNHPGIYNEMDPEFNKSLYEQIDRANYLLSNTTNIIEQQSILNSFIESFQDPHLHINWNEQNNSPKKKTTLPYKQDDFDVINISKEIAWITLPTFDINSKNKHKFNLLLNNQDDFSKKSLVIFNLRGNTGGNSTYGTQIINKLFGEACTKQKLNKSNSKIFVDWRASLDNLEHLKHMYKIYNYKWIKKVIIGMEKALNNKNHYYREIPEVNPSITQDKCKQITNTKIVLIIDNSNFSAALDFIDEIKIMSDSVYLVGEETQADRLYMEVRTVELPGNRGTFSFPIKLYHNRPRADKQTYKPDIPCDSKFVFFFLEIFAYLRYGYVFENILH